MILQGVAHLQPFATIAKLTKMINGRAKILAWFEQEENCHYWTLYKKRDHANGNYFDTNMNSGESSHSESKSRLEKALTYIDNGDFIIVCNTEPKLTSKGRRQTDFTVNSFENSPAPVASINGPGIGYVSQEQAEKIADERFTRLMEKKEYEDTKKKLVELEKETKELRVQAESGFNKLINGLAPHLGGIIKEWFPNAGNSTTAAFASAVHGTGDKDITDNNIQEAEVINTEDQAAERVNQLVTKFCEALMNKYPDTWLSIIEKLTNTVINEPGKIDMALKFL